MSSIIVAKGTHRDPRTRPCFVGCISCFRCDKRGTSACPFPNTCSGRPDTEGMREPHPDDLCRCKQGTLRWVTKEGRVIIRRYGSSPFQSKVVTDAYGQDDRDWNAFVTEKREALNDEHWDPITFADGSSTLDWTKRHYAGR